MRLLLIVLSLMVVFLLGVGLWLWLSSTLSMDHDYQHTRTTAQLPAFDASASTGSNSTLSLIQVGDFSFRARTAGFDGERGNVILLHGFPESSAMYARMIPVLAEAGFRVVAFDQRGYSPGARPEALQDYDTNRLMEDVFGVADAVGFGNFHLVGHDWGAGVGWRIVLDSPERLNSWSALSIPHIGAYARAMANDPDQQDRSAYIGFFQMPLLPEILFTRGDLGMMRRGLYAEHDDGVTHEYIQIFSEPGALTAALNWYRATNALSQQSDDGLVTTPTLFVWGNEDPVVGDLSLAAQREHFDGNLTEVELDAGHWLTATHGEAVTTAVLEHLQKHSATLPASPVDLEAEVGAMAEEAVEHAQAVNL